MTDGWSVSGGFSHAFGSDVDRFLIDLGVRYRW